MAAGDQDDEDEDAFLRMVTTGEQAAPRAEGSMKLRPVGEAAWSAACPLAPGAHIAGRPAMAYSYTLVLIGALSHRYLRAVSFVWPVVLPEHSLSSSLPGH